VKVTLKCPVCEETLTQEVVGEFTAFTAGRAASPWVDRHAPHLSEKEITAMITSAFLSPDVAAKLFGSDN